MAGVLPVGGSFVLPALPDATAPAVLGDVASGASALAPPPPPQAARQIEVNTVIVASALRAGVASVCWACFMVISPWVFVVVGPDAGEAGGDPDEAASAQDVGGFVRGLVPAMMLQDALTVLVRRQILVDKRGLYKVVPDRVQEAR